MRVGSWYLASEMNAMIPVGAHTEAAGYKQCQLALKIGMRKESACPIASMIAEIIDPLHAGGGGTLRMNGTRIMQF